mmetsp:Transcript_3940/g.4416  ORF Transcript_3940/g.4416 Transcript_3940/m.4416 type:complete len:1046 (+) Transcript_3940:269-3406(+)|eukprot:CAMPEP_0184010776 /NCGR_PEP_ID=MMETSP0954-20121128/3422_1 /TAXON_ID=627963 /ORGANISM="Aplanochytrium sp, Strain PBS07" /LENGTH=1045 /DNA_ID=CAMNT_0026290445 /DNA_START=358 /DNA_END=3495 /DNA_ORIENTATION=-
MGVPAFYRWLQEKYPKIVVPAVEIDPMIVDGVEIPVDASEPNPNGCEFDNLYLDMNCLIHPCTHPEGEEAPPTEKAMYEAIVKYLDRLFTLIRPRKVLYMAIDGVAPRAKMNQQRSRRFRSVQEAQEAAEDAERLRKEIILNGRKPPPKKPKAWDSNVITPGTPFMAELANYIRHYILERQTNNKAWKDVKVIFSDAQSPGEGEHKIMQFIRRQRAEPGHDPNTSHCLYGLDADLIMLGLATHEIHFTILREQVLFGKKKHAQSYSQDSVLFDKNNPSSQQSAPPKKRKPFDLLKVWILREYLAHEFRAEAFYLPFVSFSYDFERCIDDFVYLCFFVGNDFLPHLPSMSIREGGLELIIDLYKRLLPTLGGYITEDGDVNLERAEVVFKLLGSVEDEIFKRRRSNEMWQQQRRQQHANRNNKRPAAASYNAFAMTSTRKKIKQVEAKPAEDEFIALGGGRNKKQRKKPPSVDANKKVAALLRKSIEKKSKSEKDDVGKEQKSAPPATTEAVVEEDNSIAAKLAFEAQAKLLERKRTHHDNVVDHVRLGESGWKERYYLSKFGQENGSDPEFRREIVRQYLIGLCWVMNYYYKGCQSWKWFYPYHYAPFASDLVNLKEIKVEFSSSRPFRPVEQLLGVFPPASAHAVPKPFRWYMTSEDSPIADFYPRKFQYDPNGKGVRWLWIALLPFIDEKRLLKVVSEVESEMSDEDKKRNECAPDLIYVNRETKGADIMSDGASAIEPGIANNSVLNNNNNGITPTTAGDVRYGGRNCGSVVQADLTQGVSGYFLPPPPEYHVAVGEPVNYGNFGVIENNSSMCFEFRLAPMKPHMSTLLEGVTIPQPILTGEDLRIKKPRLGRGVDVSNLLGEQNDGRGNGYGGRNRPDILSQSGMQREWGGQRSWGSMEPRANKKSWHQNPRHSSSGQRNYVHPSYGQQAQHNNSDRRKQGAYSSGYSTYQNQSYHNQSYHSQSYHDNRRSNYSHNTGRGYQQSQRSNGYNNDGRQSNRAMQNPFVQAPRNQQQPGTTQPKALSTLDQIKANFNNLQRRR